MLNTLLPILLFAALGLAVLGALRRVNMWRRGRASKVDLLGGLLAMPKRYMVDLHHVVARDKYIANTHVATALGFVLSALLAIPTAQIATIGDMPNDVLMFERSGMSIAMANSSAEVQHAAKFVTTSNTEEGFALAMERFVLGARAVH